MPMYYREFNYHFFQPLTFERFYSRFCSEYDFESEDYAKTVFNDWLINFCHFSYLFYRAQFVYHQGIIEREFALEKGIPDGHSFSEYGLDEDWENFSDKRGLSKHHEEHEKWCSHVESLASLAKLENHISEDGSIADALEESIRISQEISQKKRPSIQEINELWFNNTICNSDEDAYQLRRTPYPDYLKTSHWQRVRAAIMMVRKACCQADRCYQIFESWYFGWESEIDVHHLHYQNKGNERYADLVLLCKDHHKQWHYNAESGLPQIEILDEEWQ